jgi:hypothetical protein
VNDVGTRTGAGGGANPVPGQRHARLRWLDSRVFLPVLRYSVHHAASQEKSIVTS